jgi:hypothetical protein
MAVKERLCYLQELWLLEAELAGLMLMREQGNLVLLTLMIFPLWMLKLVQEVVELEVMTQKQAEKRVTEVQVTE